MNRRAVMVLGLAFLSGALIHAGDLWAPFRLRGLELKGGTREVEVALRQWSRGFERFWPAGLVSRRGLDEWAADLPLQISLKWHVLQGRVTATVTAARPEVTLSWRGGTYYLSREGLLWSRQLASRFTTALPTGLPTATLADDFPLTDGKGQDDERITRVTLDPVWLLDVMKKVRTTPGLVATDVKLRRRGGEDLVACRLRAQEGGDPIEFLGRVNRLDLSLSVARELFRTGETKGFGLIDATYDDKVFLRPALNAQEQP